MAQVNPPGQKKEKRSALENFSAGLSIANTTLGAFGKLKDLSVLKPKKSEFPKVKLT